MLRAREVYNDAVLAAKALDEADNEEMRRIHWVSSITLLRASMHVLDKVDRKKSAELSDKVREAWVELKASKPQPEIFWGFIEEERNLVLKQYEIRPDVEDSFLLLENGEGYLLNEDGSRLALEGFFVLQGGPFKGSCGKKILGIALDWVDQFLAKIEA